MITQDLIYPFAALLYLVLLFIKIKKKKSIYEVLTFTFIYTYFVLLVSITIFPIPISKKLISEAAIPAKNNFVPFYSIYVLFKYSESFKPILLIPLIGNIFLFIPWGFIIRIKYNFRHFYKILISCIFASCVVEFTQLMISIFIGIFYRSIDIDDLIYNTVGSTLGFYLCDFTIKLTEKYKSNSILLKFFSNIFTSYENS